MKTYYQIEFRMWHEEIKKTFQVAHSEIFTSQEQAIDKAMEMVAKRRELQDRIAGYEINMLYVKDENPEEIHDDI